MGVNTLSMNPSRIVDVCRTIKSIDFGIAQHLVKSVISSGSLNTLMKRLQGLKVAQKGRQQIR